MLRLDPQMQLSPSPPGRTKRLRPEVAHSLRWGPFAGWAPGILFRSLAGEGENS